MTIMQYFACKVSKISGIRYLMDWLVGGKRRPLKVGLLILSMAEKSVVRTLVSSLASHSSSVTSLFKILEECVLVFNK